MEAKIIPYWDVTAIRNIKTIKDVAKEFEATFLEMMLKEMRKGIPEGMFSSFSDKMYTDMFDMTVANKLASSDRFGLAKYIENALNAYKKAENL
ncbi:rod-binding protein [Desulfurobacterium sp.]